MGVAIDSASLKNCLPKSGVLLPLLRLVQYSETHVNRTVGKGLDSATLTGIEVMCLGHLHSGAGVLLERGDRFAALADDGSGGDRRHQRLEVVVVAAGDTGHTAAIGGGGCVGRSGCWNEERKGENGAIRWLSM